jgi:hypothetical protein
MIKEKTYCHNKINLSIVVMDVIFIFMFLLGILLSEFKNG